MSVESTLREGLIKSLYVSLDILDKLRQNRALHIDPDVPWEEMDFVEHRINEALDSLEREE